MKGTEFEVHDLAVFMSEFMNRTVRKWTHEVEVSDDGPGFGAWREVEFGGTTEMASKVKERHGG